VGQSWQTYIHARKATILEERNTKAEAPYMTRGKAIPLQAWTAPEDSRRLRLPVFKTIGT
jgi:hypothetical protein